MTDSPDTAGSLPLSQKDKLVTSRLFEAYLACPTKCFLRSAGEAATGNEFANWIHKRGASYIRESTKKLTAGLSREVVASHTETSQLKDARWHLAVDQVIRAQHLEASIHAIQRMPPDRMEQFPPLVPIRFVHTNKLSRADRLMAGFDAFVLSKVLDKQIGLAKIIHGENRSTVKVKTNTLLREVRKVVSSVVTITSGPLPPHLILNRHCIECEFRDRCRKQAIEKNDLSLLANIGDKERARLNSKGIFTVNQLSYTFRPRRRIKRLATKPETYHHSLKALAIRERKIHVVGNPQFELEGTPIFFDVEGLPDRDFYYLLGLRLETDEGIEQHSLWADVATDEKRVWFAFLVLLC